MSRTYTEREIAALLARAAERQRTTPVADGAPGLSLDEVVRAAAEAGLDPAHVRAAAAEIDAGALAAPAPPPRPGAVEIERWADAPLTDAAWEEVVHVLRARYGPSASENGLVPAGPDTARVGAAHEWTHQTFGGLRTVVSVSRRGERTRLRLTQTEWGAVSDRSTAAILAGLGALMLAFVAALVVAGVDAGPVVLALVVLTALVAGTWGGTVWGTPAVRRSRERRAARAAEALAAVAVAVETVGRETPTEETDEPLPVGGVLDLDALPDPLDEAAHQPGRQRTGS